MKSLLLALSLLAISVQSHWVDSQLSSVITQENDDIWGTLQKLRDFSFPNFGGCEHTKACYLDLLTSTGFSVDPFPLYADYLTKMNKDYASGQALKNYCGTFDAVQHCFSQEIDSCRTPTVFMSIFNLTSDEAYRFVTDIDLRKIMCDNQNELADPCLATMAPVRSSIPVANDADASCTLVASEFAAAMAQTAEDAACSDAVTSAKCQVDTKTKEIETLGACDGKMPKCPSTFHSCDRMQACFDQFYDSVDKAGVKNPIPDYATYASNMKRKFETAAAIDDMCRLQETLHACLIRHINKNCPLNAASFRSMYGMNYEQAYDYSTDFELRKQQCMNKDGIKNEGTCMTLAKPLLNVCHPEIPHWLSLGRACTDLRLAMKCNNFMVRQSCPVETTQMYCITQSLVYQQGALGFCDGWMPECVPFGQSTDAPKTSTVAPDTTTSSPPKTSETTVTTTTPTTTTVTTTTKTTAAPEKTTSGPTVPTESPLTSSSISTVSVTSPSPTTPTTSNSPLSLPILSALLVTLRLIM